MDQQWKSYEDEPFWSVDHIRNFLLPPSVAKRHFCLPSVNRVGLALPEVLIAVAMGAILVILGLSQRVAEAEESGSIAQLLWVPPFVFVTYRSVARWLLGVSFERGMFWHGYLALLATGYGAWHGVAAMYWAELDDDDGDEGQPVRGFDAFFRGEYRFAFVTGGLCTLFMILTVLSSVHPIRRAMPRLWLWSHHFLPTVALVLAILHGAPVTLVGPAIYLADRAAAYVFDALVRFRVAGAGARAVFLQRSGLVRISLPKPRGLVIRPGQFMCVNIPAVSPFEFHAYSVASAPGAERIVFFVRPLGRWSRRLARLVSTQAQARVQEQITKATPTDEEVETEIETEVDIRAFAHGPIGNIALDWQSSRYNTFVLVAGGIGVTPMLSTLAHLADQRRRGRPLRLVHFVWACRTLDIVVDVLSHWDRRANVDSGKNTLAIDGFRTRVFLTKGDSAADMEAGADALADLKHLPLAVEINYGRPSWYNRDGRNDQKKASGIFEEVAKAVTGTMTKRVAVLVCGPQSLTTEVSKKASAVSQTGVNFDVHLEHFN